MRRGHEELATGCSQVAALHVIAPKLIARPLWLDLLFASSSSSGTWFPGCYWGGAGEFLQTLHGSEPCTAAAQANLTSNILFCFPSILEFWVHVDLLYSTEDFFFFFFSL